MTGEQQFILAYVDNAEHLSYEESLRKAELHDKRAAEELYDSVQDNMTAADRALFDSLDHPIYHLSSTALLAC